MFHRQGSDNPLRAAQLLREPGIGAYSGSLGFRVSVFGFKGSTLRAHLQVLNRNRLSKATFRADIAQLSGDKVPKFPSTRTGVPGSDLSLNPKP